jgi:U3 small nucleolar RNA-associated protein 11
MLSADKARAGQHGKGDTQKNRLSHDAVKLLKTQDLAYVRVVAGQGRREISKLEEAVGMTMTLERGKKVLFTDEKDGPNTLRGAAASERRNRDEPTVAGAAEYEDQHKHPSAPQAECVPATDAAEESTESSIPPQPTALRTKKSQSAAAQRSALHELRTAHKRRKRLAELRVAKLNALKTRQREIMAATHELEAQRARMARTIGGVNKDGVRWKIRERKR